MSNALSDLQAQSQCQNMQPREATTLAGVKTHGAQVVITYSTGSLGFVHLTTAGASSPRVELFPDGVRIGCTFVTTDALQTLAREHAAFLVERSKVLQP